ncbi:MAG: hypothetical protein HC788_14005 [Sphingopyxis sp.]|nr:hypothetical protein [Sphingopyxis sp.]
MTMGEGCTPLLDYRDHPLARAAGLDLRLGLYVSAQRKDRASRLHDDLNCGWDTFGDAITDHQRKGQYGVPGASEVVRCGEGWTLRICGRQNNRGSARLCPVVGQRCIVIDVE